MEPQETFTHQIQDIYASQRTRISILANELLEGLYKTPEELQKLLSDLIDVPLPNISFALWAHFARILLRTVISSKKRQLLFSLGEYFAKCAKSFFTFTVYAHNEHRIAQFVKIAKKAFYTIPENYTDQLYIILYLQQTEIDAEWQQGFLQYCSNTLLVDKKSQDPKALKINPYFSSIISRNLGKLMPQLERLMVRSQSNLQVIVEFLESVKRFKKIGEFSGILLKKYKGLFLTKSQISLRFVKALSSSLTSDQQYCMNFQIIKGLLSSEHNAKKKIVYFRMLEGFAFSIKKYHLSDKLANQLLSLIANSWIKFPEQAEAIYVYQLLENVLPLITNPGPEIAEACKQSLKSQNKNILIFTGVTLSEVYCKAEHLQQFGSVKQAATILKSQLDGMMKKKEANWQSILHILNFLATSNLNILEMLSDLRSFFKSSCLALVPLQQKNCVTLFGKYVNYLQSEQDEELELEQDQLCTLSVLIEQNRKRGQLAVVTSMSDRIKIQLLQKGIYPFVFFDVEKTCKNKGNRFVSLIRALFQSLNNKVKFSDDCFEKLLCLANYANLDLSKYFQKQETDKTWVFAQKYIKLSLYSCEQDYKLCLEPTIRNIVTKNVHYFIKLCRYDQFDLIFSKMLNKQFYEKDRSFIEQFELEVINTMKVFHESHQELQKKLIDLQYHTEKKQSQRKVYLGTNFDSKMMNEAEVKEQQYRQHLSKMFNYSGQLIEIIKSNIKDHSLVSHLWEIHFDGLVHIVTYPEQRMPIYKIVKASFENITQTESLHHLFLSFSQFMADFYAVRGAHFTPQLSIMQKCERFLSKFLDSDYTKLNKDSFILKFINDICLYILQNMEFDLSVKEQSLAFFKCAIQKQMHLENFDDLFSFLVKNLNIISNNDDIPIVLEACMRHISPQRYTQLFIEILNYIKSTKKLILQTILKINEIKIYDPSFEDYIKLRILSLDDSDDDIANAAEKILKNENKNVKSIAHFDMKHFIENNTKETIEKLCRFMKQETTDNNIKDVFTLVLKTGNLLYEVNFDQEGLEFLPYYLSLNIDNIPIDFLDKIFEILVLKYTANDEYATLSRMSLDIGIDIIKKYAPKHAEKLLKIMESFLSSNSISNIVFLGVLAPYVKGNKNLEAIQNKITQLFNDDKQNQQRSIAKSMPDLMSFFKNPDAIIDRIFNQIGTMDRKLQSGQSYLFVGLIKGLGYKKMMTYLDLTIKKQVPAKASVQKMGLCYLLRGFVQNFGRIIELRSLEVVERLLGFMSDQNQQVRNQSKSVTQYFITRMSSYGIKQLLPHLLSGLETVQNWKIKISYIWILGIMANCAAKQLQTSLPIIVPTLSVCLSNAHPTIRQKAAQALNLIGQTIKNPEISQTIDILIEALENPFEKSEKALELLLKTRFSHYIDAPSLSLIVPIIDYCLRGRVSELKEGACQVLGSIIEIILNPSDILPYLKILAVGIKTAICDPLPQIRSIAAMAIGKISAKIGADNAKQYFSFIFQLVGSHSSNTTEKTGAAQAYAQIICSQDYDYFEESLNFIFTRLSQEKSVQKEGYILIFLYVPAIRRNEFEGFIKEVNEHTYSYVSDEEETLRNSSMQVSKVLINNYGISHTDLLLQPLCNGIFEENWRKRNAALMLLGELLNILKSYMYHNKTNDKAPALYQAMMAVYIMKDDDLQMPRVTANQVWNTYIENTPKTIKSGLKDLIRMWTKFTHSASGVVFRNITGFSGKYGENYFMQIIDFLCEYSSEPEHKKGVFEVLGQFIKRLTQQYLSKSYLKTSITKLFDSNIFSIQNQNREALTKALALYVDKMHEEDYFESMIYPQIDKMGHLNEEDPLYTETLHLIRDLLNTSSVRIVDRLITKITTPPLSEFTIEVITNNSDKIANNLYTLFKTPATESMLEQIFTLVALPEKANRLSLLVYCLNQVSIRLNQKHKNLYISMIIREIRNISNGKRQNSSKSIQKILEMLVFFLNSIPLTQIDCLDQLIGEITPYIFKGETQVNSNAHRIFMILISDNKSSQTGQYYKQLIVSLENNKSNKQIWTQKDIVKDYINILVKGLAYGINDNLNQNLQMLKFLIKETNKDIIAPMIVRVVGPIIRIASYPLSHSQKQKLLDFLTEVYCSGYQLEVYNHQVVSVCMRMLFEQRRSIKIHEIIEQVSKTLEKVLQRSTHRQILLNLVVAKIKQQGQYLIEMMCQLLENILKNNSKMFPNPTYEKLRHEFYTILTNNESQLSVKGIYYLAKLCGMLSCFFKAGSPQKIESINCTYEDILMNLHLFAYNKEAVPKFDKIELLIKQSSKDKVAYLLKTLLRCKRANIRTEQLYTYEYIQSLIPENIAGFQDIIEMLEYFE